MASTRTAYTASLCNPVMVYAVAGGAPRSVCIRTGAQLPEPSTAHATVYAVMARSPSAGALHDTSISPSPATREGAAGADGTPATTLTVKVSVSVSDAAVLSSSSATV